MIQWQHCVEELVISNLLTSFVSKVIDTTRKATKTVVSKPNQTINKSKSLAEGFSNITSKTSYANGLIILAVFALVLYSSGAPQLFSQESIASQGGPVVELDEISLSEFTLSVAESADLAVLGHIESATEGNGFLTEMAVVDDTYLAKPVIAKSNNVSIQDIRTYTTKSSQSISSIAKKFDVTSDTIRWANGYMPWDSTVPAGKKLVIPPINGVLHKVQKGDSFDSLAKKYKANSQQIIAFNDLEVKGLKPGQRIVIPDGTKAEPRRPRPEYTPSSIRYAGGDFCGSEGASRIKRVSAGQPIGVMGSTGRSTGTHLHLGMCSGVDGYMFDPISNTSSYCPTRPGIGNVTAEGCSLKYGFRWPTASKSYYISRGFYAGHAGFDLDNYPVGDMPTIMAVGSGDIIACGYMGAGGNTVVIRHDNGIVTHYMHLSRLYC